MIQVIDNRGTGKTLRLILMAKEQNGIVVCSNPAAMKEKVEHGYGITGVDYLSYLQYIQCLRRESRPLEKPIFIDEVSTFLKILDKNIFGYSESLNDSTKGF